ncbi:helix-turn-helix domain-containing protein [bacterium]|nr:helix-turn-helix domain-containing protein [bacterium]
MAQRFEKVTVKRTRQFFTKLAGRSDQFRELVSIIFESLKKTQEALPGNIHELNHIREKVDKCIGELQCWEMIFTYGASSKSLVGDKSLIAHSISLFSDRKLLIENAILRVTRDRVWELFRYLSGRELSSILGCLIPIDDILELGFCWRDEPEAKASKEYLDSFAEWRSMRTAGKLPLVNESESAEFTFSLFVHANLKVLRCLENRVIRARGEAFSETRKPTTLDEAQNTECSDGMVPPSSFQWRGKRPTERLTKTEYKLLAYIFERRANPPTVNELKKQFWPKSYDDRGSYDRFATQLRRKLNPIGATIDTDNGHVVISPMYSSDSE